MLKRSLALGMVALAWCGAPVAAAPADDDLARLDWLAGTWSSSTFEATYTSPKGGMIFSVNKEFERGKVIFFEWEKFEVQDGNVRMTPYVNGKPADSFTLIDFDPKRSRAHFQNPAHDFPTDIIYELKRPDNLVIKVSGVEQGKPKVLTFDLMRVAKTAVVEPSKKQTFIYLLKASRPNLMNTLTHEEAALFEAHSKYLSRLRDEHRLILAGPTKDYSFGLVIFEASSAEEARQIVQADPIVKGKVLTAELKPYFTPMMRTP